jgi:L-ascorbate metabolism protein UlaG (beta-lactamase superfamily)
MSTNLGNLELTFCGHATFSIKTPGGKHVVVDPFFEQNPSCPERLKNPASVDAMLVTHPHLDHCADTVSLAKKHDAICLAIIETAAWLENKGVKHTIGMNKGGTTEVAGVKVTMTHAVHSAGIRDGEQIVYGGEAAGYVMTFENGVRVYHAGDTCVFSDMKIIGDLYKPDIALLPIGDFYTMDPLQGAYAIRLLGVKTVVPMHYATFPVLTGTPDKLRELTQDIAGLDIIDLKPGETLTGDCKRLALV